MPRMIYPEDHSGDVENDPAVLETQCYWVRGSDGQLARHPEQNRTRVFMQVENADLAAEAHQKRMRELGQQDFEAWAIGPGRPDRPEQNLAAIRAGKPVPYPAVAHSASPVAAQVNAKIEAENLLQSIAAENEVLRKKLAELEAQIAPAADPESKENKSGGKE